MESHNSDYAYCPGPHKFPTDTKRQMRLVIGPFRVMVRIVKEKIASRCPVCGKTPYSTKEEAVADIGKGIRF